MIEKVDGYIKKFPYELMDVDGETVMLLEYDDESMIWVEFDKIKSNDEELLRSYMKKYGYHDISFSVDRLSPGLHHLVMEIPN
jgi:hypothetical protein